MYFEHNDVTLIMILILSVVKLLFQLFDLELSHKQLQLHLGNMNDIFCISSNKFTYIRRYDLMP